jgi:hypothetical protein
VLLASQEAQACGLLRWSQQSCAAGRAVVTMLCVTMSALPQMQLLWSADALEFNNDLCMKIVSSVCFCCIATPTAQPVESNAASNSSSSSAKRDPSTQFLSASLANPSGGVVGGMVAGPLVAAGPVMVIIGHWEPDEHQQAGPIDDAVAAAAAGAAAATPAAAAADDDSGRDADGDYDDVVAGGGAVLLQQLGGANLAAAVAAAAAANGGEGLLGLPIGQLQSLLSAAAAAERDGDAAHGVGSAAAEQAGTGWCGGLGLGGQAGNGEQHEGDEEEQDGDGE